MSIGKSLLVVVVCAGARAPSAGGQALPSTESRVVVSSRGWQLIGDLRLPATPGPAPAVLLLNGAADDRTVYRELAQHLADSGVASLALVERVAAWLARALR